ncbi:MAG TPA: GNAT family N-acetyltransferase [Gallionellaceae bacterium]|nr:GNAT family N-acetyltransferase [Gallionellaceae bacterium]
MITKVIENLADIPAAQWDALAENNPFLKHAYLSALQQTGCAIPQTGWQAQFITLWEGGQLIGGMPLYLKSHSYGEFVFDWAWADAYQRNGLRYYPKLVCSVPFTPASGPRLLAKTREARADLVRAALELAKGAGVSSLHLLFPYESQAEEMQAQGMMLRRGVQLHWRNAGYADFDTYLAGMRRDKRKKIKQERRKVSDAGITFEHIRGEQITPEQWEFFVRCYAHTHVQYNSPQPLNLAFFQRIGTTMPQHILLIIASRDGEPIAGAINFYNHDTLFGRSWGALEYHPGLHFETCYYQAIDFCIRHRIALFEGGAQGEHKLARGFLPSTTWSAHWLAHPQYAKAVEEFLQREAGGVDLYMEELNDSSPFKRAS